MAGTLSTAIIVAVGAVASSLRTFTFSPCHDRRQPGHRPSGPPAQYAHLHVESNGGVLDPPVVLTPSTGRFFDAKVKLVCQGNCNGGWIRRMDDVVEPNQIKCGSLSI